MSRKHYVAIAQQIEATLIEARAGHLTAEEAVAKVACRLADVASDDNARFDCARFLKACGVRS